MQSDEGEINLVDILCWLGVMVVKEQDFDVIVVDILVVFDGVLDDFIVVCEMEGQVLKVFIEQWFEGVSGEVVKVCVYMLEIFQWQCECLVVKLEDVEVQLENNCFE